MRDPTAPTFPVGGRYLRDQPVRNRAFIGPLALDEGVIPIALEVARRNALVFGADGGQLAKIIELILHV